MLKTNKKTKIILLSILITAIAYLFIVFFGLQNIWFDFILNSQVKNEGVDKNIVLITIDENTIKKYSEPTFWTRSRYESLLNDLELQKPKAIVFDYYFNSKSNPENVDWNLIEQVSGLSTEKVDDIFYKYDADIKETGFLSSIDRDFINSVRKGGNVFFPYLANIDKNNRVTGIKIDTFDSLKRHSRGGYVNTLIDSDGTIRRFPLLDSDKYFSLSQEVVSYVTKTSNKLNPLETYLVRYSNLPKKGFDIIPFELAYNGFYEDKSGKEISLKDKIVIIGDYGEIFGDYYKVSIGGGRLMPGMEILAYEMKNLIDKNYITDIGNINRVIVGITLYIVFLIAFITIGSNIISLLLFLLINAVFIYLEFKFIRSNLYMSYVLFFPIILSSYLSPLLVNTYEKLLEKIRMKKFFSKFVGKNIVDLIVSRPDINLDGEKKEITIFFADIKNFTTLSEKLSPENVVSILNRIFKESNEIIFKHKGTLDKYIGDAIMAFWGAPMPNDEHAKSACIVALEFTKKIKEINEELKKEYDLDLSFRIGINSGTVTVGSVGTEDFSDYTVIGDNVNLTSRLEGINKFYNTNIIITQKTLSLLDSDFVVRELDTIIVKGKTEPITIYELLDYKGMYVGNENIPKIIKNHLKGLALYRDGKLLEAKGIFKLNKEMKDPVAKAFIDRINLLDIKKKDNWNGVWEFSEK